MKKVFDSIFKEDCYIEIRGTELVMLDGLEKLLCYENEKIIIRCSERCVKIYGSSLTMDYLSDSRIAIKGKIKGVEFMGDPNV